MNDHCLSLTASYKNLYPKETGHTACAIYCADADTLAEQDIYKKNGKLVYTLPSIRSLRLIQIDTPVYHTQTSEKDQSQIK